MSNFTPIKLNNEENQIISKILDLPIDFIDNRKYLACIDKFELNDNKLYLVHYNQDKIEELLSLVETNLIFSKENIVKILSYRGYIINLTTEKICCKSYGFTVNVNIDEIPNKPFYFDVLNEIVDPEELDYKIYYGGTLIRIWSIDGINMFSTHKKINAVNSFWGSTTTFLQLFEQNQDTYKLQNIPIDEDTVSIFLINDNSLLIDTRNKISKNKIVYIETISLVDSSLNQEMTDIMKNNILS